MMTTNNAINSGPIPSGGEILVSAYLNDFIISNATGNSTIYSIAYNTVNTNVRSMYSGSTFTADTDMNLLVTASVAIASSTIASDNLISYFQLNINSGSSYLVLDTITPISLFQSSSGQYIFSGSAPVNLSTNDTLQAQLIVTGHATANIGITGTLSGNVFSTLSIVQV